jgi:hypothetical protein
VGTIEREGTLTYHVKTVKTTNQRQNEKQMKKVYLKDENTQEHITAQAQAQA